MQSSNFMKRDPAASSTASFGSYVFTQEEVERIAGLLMKKLGPEYCSTRGGHNGAKMTYIEGWRVINIANEVFTFNGWSHSIIDMTVDYVDVSPDGRISLGLSCIVRVSLKDGTFHEDIGYGTIENARTKAAAFEKAKKEAVTDALKRALRNFGNILGNCFYDKEYLKKLGRMKAPPSRDFIEDSELYGRTAASSAIQYPRPAPLQQQQQQPQRQQPQPQPQQPQQQFQQQQQQNQPQQQFQQRPPNNNIRMNPGPTHIPAPDSPDDMLLVADVECLDASILCRSPNRVQKPNFTPPKPIQQQQQQQPNASNFQFNNPPSLTMKKENVPASPRSNMSAPIPPPQQSLPQPPRPLTHQQFMAQPPPHQQQNQLKQQQQPPHGLKQSPSSVHSFSTSMKPSNISIPAIPNNNNIPGPVVQHAPYKDPTRPVLNASIPNIGNNAPNNPMNRGLKRPGDEPNQFARTATAAAAANTGLVNQFGGGPPQMAPKPMAPHPNTSQFGAKKPRPDA